MIDRQRYDALGLAEVHDRVVAGERLDLDQGRALFECPDILAVGALAHHRRTALHGKKTFYVLNQHINYTNVCVNGCVFCAYHRELGQEGGFKLSVDDAMAKIDASPLTPREIHIVGGCHPKLGLDYFEELLSSIKRRLPQAALKCFTAVEIAHFAELEGISTREVLTRLKAAGLDMLPGGGAEIFDEELRAKLCPRKLGSQGWLDVHRQAHELGLSTNCTMLFGHLETIGHRLDHLDRLRRLQDETGGFNCFIPLPFQVENSALDVGQGITGIEELRTIAVSRLMLDNIPHVKAYWIMLTTKQAQTALFFGADDFDGTVVEEKIGHMAGAKSEDALTRAELETMIRGCGLVPVERDARFNPVDEEVAS